MPMRQMIKHSAASILGYEPGDSWITRFLNHNKDTLITAWIIPMESNHHKADSGEIYSQFFELLRRKMD